MLLEKRISAFVQLGKILEYFTSEKNWPGYECGLNEEEFDRFNNQIKLASIQNKWFTEEFVRLSLAGIVKMLDEKNLQKWSDSYTIDQTEKKSIALIMAGNIPMVGFHDVMCVLVSGHKALVKMSSEDNILLTEIFKILTHIAPDFTDKIKIANEKLNGYDAVIATGSNNSARYFKSYFKNVPHIIRKNRTSIAILDGNESDETLELLADDIFLYFGLGCRNVSKIFIPENFDLDRIFKALYKYKDILNHNKYANNYDYNKTIYLMNQVEILENGFHILKKDSGLHSPLAVSYYERYSRAEDVKAFIDKYEDEIQCIVSNKDIAFGQAQFPEIDDYADGVDTMQFLGEV